MDNQFNKNNEKAKTKSYSKKEAEEFLKLIPGWQIDEQYKKIFREYQFKDFFEAMEYVKKIAELANAENHHPNIHIFYNKVLLELSTHSVDGLSGKDFILAAKIDTL